MLDLKQMSVIVTGGASGIGLATARMLVERGARVLVADYRQSAVEAALAQLKDAFPSAHLQGTTCDVRSSDDCQRLVETALGHFERIDALVHSAGILRPPGSRPRPLYEVDDAEFEAVVDTNLKGTFLVNRAVLRAMVAQRSGQVINLSSSSGRRARPLDAVYSASKAGVISLSESAAEEVRGYGIRVQVLLPDAVATPLWDQNGPVPPPPVALSPARVAEVILMMLALPMDATCEQLLITPLESRRLRTKRTGPREGAAEG